MNDKKMMQIVGAVQRTVGEEKKSFWTRIGTARLSGLGACECDRRCSHCARTRRRRSDGCCGHRRRHDGLAFGAWND